jgi:hypothetical protein
MDRSTQVVDKSGWKDAPSLQRHGLDFTAKEHC